VAQEFQSVFTASTRSSTGDGPPQFSFPQRGPAGHLFLLLRLGRRLRPRLCQAVRLVSLPGQGMGQRERGACVTHGDACRLRRLRARNEGGPCGRGLAPPPSARARLIEAVVGRELLLAATPGSSTAAGRV
jgi:hypothetical protein